jgi:hypothetical protein
MTVADWQLGTPRDPQTHADLRACEEVANAFAELLDAGDLEQAFARHAPDVRFWGPGAAEPTGRDDAIAGAAAVRFAYPGRQTLHLISNFLARPLDDGTIEAQYALTVYELTEPGDGGAVPLPAPRVFALAHELAVFRRDPEGWRYVEHRLVPVAPLRLPGAGR